MNDFEKVVAFFDELGVPYHVEELTKVFTERFSAPPYTMVELGQSCFVFKDGVFIGTDHDSICFRPRKVQQDGP